MTGEPTAPLWRAAVVLRVVTLLFAVGVIATHHGDYARPGLAVAAAVVMTGWTTLSSVYYLRDGERALAFTVLDLTVCCLVMAASRWALTAEQLASPLSPLLSTVWVTGAVAAGAVRGGPASGLAFGVLVGAVNIAVRGRVDVDLVRDLVLLAGIGFVLGWAARTSRIAARQLATALRAEAATAERERLARSIHDGVLQVLARVRQRGAEVGGEAAELAALAGEQEIALRALVAAAAPESSEDGLVDLVPGLQLLASGRTPVSVPATAVPLPATTSGELVAVVGAALSNVERHAGDGARAWVLLEDLGDEVVLTVRDDGVGIPAGRIAAASAQGRMGVARSIRGRVRDLGGTVALETAPGAGTEWEVRVPKSPARRNGESR